MSDEQERLTGVWADLRAVRGKLMDAQNEITRILFILEAMEGENG